MANMVADTFGMSPMAVPQLKSRIPGDRHARLGSLPIAFINVFKIHCTFVFVSVF